MNLKDALCETCEHMEKIRDANHPHRCDTLTAQISAVACKEYKKKKRTKTYQITSKQHDGTILIVGEIVIDMDMRIQNISWFISFADREMEINDG